MQKFNSNALARVVQKLRRPSVPLAVYLGNDLALTETIFKHALYVDTRDISLTPHLIRRGRWEMDTTAAIAQAVKPGMQVIEIGTNVGYYSVILADIAGKSGRYTGFEANPRMCEIARMNLQVNGHYYHTQNDVKELAVTDTVGTARFSVFEKHMGSSSLFDLTETADNVKDKINFIDVKTTTLDDSIEPGTKIDFMKIDAEGAEPEIFKGAARVLTESKNVKVILEFDPKGLRTRFDSPALFIDQLNDLGFSASVIGKRGRLTPFSRQDADVSTQHADLLLSR